MTLPGSLITGIRIITGGRLGQSGQERGFGKFKIPRSFSEINLRGRFNPISAVAKINMIEIEIQNFLFRKGTVDLIGQDGFLDFAAVTFFRGQIEGLGDLLRNGAAPLDNPSGPEISEKGPEMLCTSKPRCSKNRASSAARKALMTRDGISSNLTSLRFSM